MTRLILAAALATTGGLAVAQMPPAATPAPHGPRMMRLDTDHDGLVSRTEAKAAADRRFARLDANHDGAVTADEFRARAIARFDRRDANRDGRLDRGERVPRRGMARPGA
jgi:hypothetical protein